MTASEIARSTVATAAAPATLSFSMLLRIRTEVTSVRILSNIENDNVESAASVAVVLLVISLAVIVALDVIQRRVASRG